MRRWSTGCGEWSCPACSIARSKHSPKACRRRSNLSPRSWPIPSLLILDEPFSGLDPVNAQVLKDAVLEMRQRGTTVVFSTHDMATAERMCDRIFMIFRGRKVLDGTLESIQNEYGADTVRIRTSDGSRRARRHAGRRSVNDFGQLQEVRLNGDPQAFLSRLVARAIGLSLRGDASLVAGHFRPHRKPGHSIETQHNHAQNLDRRSIRIRHARAEQGIPHQPRSHAARHGRIGDAGACDERRHRHERSDLRARRLHRRGGRAAQGGCRHVQRRRPIADGCGASAKRCAVHSSRDQAVAADPEPLRLDLSNRVRAQEFFAFVESRPTCSIPRPMHRFATTRITRRTTRYRSGSGRW